MICWALAPAAAWAQSFPLIPHQTEPSFGGYAPDVALPPPTSAETFDWSQQGRQPQQAGQTAALTSFFDARGVSQQAVEQNYWNHAAEPWTWQVLPEGLLYRSYLAGAKEARLGSEWTSDPTFGNIVDSTLGGRVGLLRFGNTDPYDPHGWQWDVEAAALLRQEWDEAMEVMATDFRVGTPLTYANGAYRMKIAWYHLSSHLGDEYMLRTGAPRINYSRDVIVWGHAFYLTPNWRIYGEVGYAFLIDDGAKPWEFQFGVEYSPAEPTGLRGAPFLALNAHLREDVNFGGNFVAQLGWAWRGSSTGGLLRIGLDYYNGKSPQFEFYDTYEHQIGAGIWYDF